MSDGTEVTYVRRVIGLPGERVQLQDGVVYVNDVPLRLEPVDRLPDVTCPKNFMVQEEHCTFFREFSPLDLESHIIVSLNAEAVGDNTKEFLVPADHYFLLGDNRDNSLDSRFSVGYVPFENLVGRANIIFFSIADKASPLEIWKWPTEVRFGRLFSSVAGTPHTAVTGN